MDNVFRCSRATRVLSTRHFHSSKVFANEDLRERLTAGVKLAMKNKDQAASTTLRSVLSDVYNLDKSSGAKVSSSAIVAVLRKAVLRRTESAAEFVKGSRPDLAEKESREADIISSFLPPMLSEAEIDRALKEAIDECPRESNPRKYMGIVFKSFYSKVDRSNVDADIVKNRAEILINAQS